MTTVITYGTFDVFHRGHARLLERARKLGDRLIVGVTSSDYDRGRGKLNVTDSLPERIKSVEESGFADLIIVEEHEGQKIRDILSHGVDIFAIGSDWEGQFDYLADYCEVVYLPRTAGVSSTQRRNDVNGLLRVGVIGTGRIAHRMMREARFVSGLEMVAAYNPRPGAAGRFADLHGMSRGCADLTSFLDEVDAVYIASPHGTHSDYSQRSLLAGRHVLCEKPAALTRAELRVALELAEQGNLVFLEALKTAFLPGFERLVNVVRSGAIGEIRALRCAFTKLVDAGGREWQPEDGGAMSELGSYCLLPMIKLLGQDVPPGDFSVVRERGVDAFVSARFNYPQAVATLEVGLSVKTEGSLVVSGATGFVKVPAPWWLTRAFEVHREDPAAGRQYSVPFEGDGLRYELSEFVRLVNNRARPSLALTAQESLTLAGVHEGFRRERGPGASASAVRDTVLRQERDVMRLLAATPRTGARTGGDR